MEAIIKKRFGIHRGVMGEKYTPNSLEAIAEAVKLAPPFVEFDVSLVDKKLRTGHPPQQEPLDELGDVLDLFEGKKTYPKIDIKRRSDESVAEAINQVLDVINKKQINFSLINIGTSVGDRKDVMQAELYLAKMASHNPAIKLNVDTDRYKPTGDINEDEGIREHVKRLGPFLFSISPEIHSSNGEAIGRFVQKHGIGTVAFWFFEGESDDLNPEVTEKTVRKALALEKKYPVTVYFDINPAYVA